MSTIKAPQRLIPHIKHNYTYFVRPSKLLDINATSALLKAIQVPAWVPADIQDWKHDPILVQNMNTRIRMDQINSVQAAPVTPFQMHMMGEVSLGHHEDRRRVHVDQTVELAMRALYEKHGATVDSILYPAAQVDAQASFVRYGHLFGIMGAADKAYYTHDKLPPFFEYNEHEIRTPPPHKDLALQFVTKANTLWNRPYNTISKYEKANAPIRRNKGTNFVWQSAEYRRGSHWLNIFIDYKSVVTNMEAQMLWYLGATTLTAAHMGLAPLPLSAVGILSDAFSYYSFVGFQLNSDILEQDDGRNNYFWIDRMPLDGTDARLCACIDKVTSFMHYVYSSANGSILTPTTQILTPPSK